MSLLSFKNCQKKIILLHSILSYFSSQVGARQSPALFHVSHLHYLCTLHPLSQQLNQQAVGHLLNLNTYFFLINEINQISCIQIFVLISLKMKPKRPVDVQLEQGQLEKRQAFEMLYIFKHIMYLVTFTNKFTACSLIHARYST